MPRGGQICFEEGMIYTLLNSVQAFKAVGSKYEYLSIVLLTLYEVIGRVYMEYPYD